MISNFRFYSVDADFVARITKMKQQIGILLQFAVLVFLPMMLLYDLDFGIKRLLVMPISLGISAALFWIGHRLRES